QYPQPLNLIGIQRALDPGTVLLAYSVYADKTRLFVVSRPRAGAPAESGLHVFTLPVGQAQLERDIRDFQAALMRPESSQRGLRSTTAVPADLNESGRRLYELLVGPAAANIAPHNRILLSPDGPLHALSFAALRRTERSAGRQIDRGFLIEWKPLHLVQ